jgi:predicted dehydrogenase
VRDIRVAIVGTGGIARVHAAALGPAAVLAAAADVDPGRLAAFALDHGVPATYGQLDDLLREVRPDLVHICTPPHAHHEQALACLRAGVSVLVEKPPVISLREFDELTAAESAAGPWFASVYQHRFGAAQRRLKALAAAGTFGRPLLAVCHTTWFRDQAYFDVPWRGRWETEGGGPTVGHGIHQMDMLLDVLGDWAEVRAIARRQARRTRTEDLAAHRAAPDHGHRAAGPAGLVVRVRDHDAQRQRPHGRDRQPDHRGPGERRLRRAVLARARRVRGRPGADPGGGGPGRGHGLAGAVAGVRDPGGDADLPRFAGQPRLPLPVVRAQCAVRVRVPGAVLCARGPGSGWRRAYL